MLKKIVALVMVGLLVVVGLTSCQKVEKASVQVKIVGYNDVVIYEGAVADVVSENGKNPVVADVLLAMQTYEYLDEVVLSDTHADIKKINEYEAQPDTENTGVFVWSYKINNLDLLDEASGLSDAATDIVKDGDVIIFSYTFVEYPEESET